MTKKLLSILIPLILFYFGCSKQETPSSPKSTSEATAVPTSTPTQLLSTKWEKYFGGVNEDISYSVQQTSDGGYIVAGVTFSYGEGSGDAFLVKLDAAGNCVWSRTYGGANYDDGFSVKQTSDDGYILTGYTSFFGSGAFLIKTDADGNSIWVDTYNADSSHSVELVSGGGYIIAGKYNGNISFIKTNSNGNVMWEKNYGGSSDEEGYFIQRTQDNGFIAIGYTLVSYYDIYLVKIDADGNTQWIKTYGSSAKNDIGYSVAQTLDGGYILVGETDSFGAGGQDVYLIKTDADGNCIWAKTFGGANSDIGYSVRQTSDGGYIVAGETESFGAGNGDVYLIKTYANGDVDWIKTYGGINGDFGWDVQQTSDGGYIIAGGTYSYGAGGSDFYLIKTDANGNTTNP